MPGPERPQGHEPEPQQKPLVGIIMGSDSDLPVMIEACRVLRELDVAYETDIVSAHRTPDEMVKYARDAEVKGIKVIIAGAGGAAHLQGMAAAITKVMPVIGVPIRSSTLSGVDSLLSVVQMPPGIPVATVAINGAKNAGILAAQILGVSDEDLKERIDHFREDLYGEVRKKSNRIRDIGEEDYLDEMEKK